MEASLYSSLIQDMEGSTQNPQEPLTKNYLQSLMALIPEEQPLRPSSVQTSNEEKIFQLVQKILQKPSQNRSSQQLAIVVSFSNKNKYLKKMQEEIGTDFVRNIMKYAKIIRLSPGKIICKEKESITHFYLVLRGKIGLKRTQEVNTDVETNHIYELLTLIAKKQAKQINKALQNQMTNTVKIFHQIKESLEEIQQQFFDHVWKNEIYGPFDYCVGKQHLSTAIITQQCVLLQFNIFHFLSFLDRSHNAKMKKQMNLVSHIPCFKFIPSAKLEQFLGSMILRKKKRKQLIYKQGEPTESIFILTQGQIKITKNTNLFQENPNNFYINRNKLIDGKQNPMDRPTKLLPYANLTRLYNYRPVSKLIQIGVLSPICLFGQQEMIQQRIRETNAQCNSLQVTYYEIQIKRIQQIFGQMIMDQFKYQIKNQIKKKLLYRQNQYANTVQLQNNKNLDYFYFDGQKEKDSPRKFNITKINSKITPTNIETRSQSQQLPAYYTAFNFHKMGKETPKTQSKSTKKMKKQDSFEDEQQICKDPIEKKLIQISHTWGPITRKVKQQVQLSKKISPFKQAIDIQSPLFDPKYFIQRHLQNKRIQKNFRTKKFNLGFSGRKTKQILDRDEQQN